MALTKSKKIQLDVFWCDECEMWLRSEETFVCGDCGERFCHEDERPLLLGDDFIVCETCFTKDESIAEKMNRGLEATTKAWIDFNKVFMDKQ